MHNNYRLGAAFLIIVSVIFSLMGCGQKNIAFERTVKNDVVLEEEPVGGLKESIVLSKLRSIAEQLDIPSRDARLNEKNWTIAENEKSGRAVNIEKTLQNLFNSNEGDRLKLVIEERKPLVSAENLKKNVVEIARYSTPLVDRQTARINNIELAAEKINYKILQPGEEFSFNKTVGRRTEAKGYEEAPIIIKTEDGYKKGYGVGGGICQLATTIYNTAQKSGLEITERHEHSKNVGYVPKGKDATVSYGSVDLKIRNNRNYPIMFRTSVGKKALTVWIIENRNNNDLIK